MSPGSNSDKLAIVICSYRPDFERCQRLCASMDAFVRPETSQVIVVPERDRQLFRRLETTYRTIVSTQDVLPARFTHLPLLTKWWLDGGLWPIRGWMMQQLTKLCADKVTDREYIMFVDSDIEFMRSLEYAHFLKDGALRLHRKPLEKNEGVHLKWHHTSAQLLGLTPRYFGSDYVGPLATWTRTNLIQLKQHIENNLGQPWFEAVGRKMTVSEYTLYGVFVEHVLGLRQAGHFGCAQSLCHCLWFGNETGQFLEDFKYQQPPQAILLQSNIGMVQKDVNLLMDRVRQQLATS